MKVKMIFLRSKFEIFEKLVSKGGIFKGGGGFIAKPPD